MISYDLSGGRVLRIATLLLVIMVGGASAVTPINECTTISSPGEYILTRNIEDFSQGNCITIASNDVVFDGANFTIDGVTKNFTYGVYINNPLTTLKHVTVKNLKVTDWYYGISYEKIQYGSITNSIVNLNGNESLSIIKNNSYFFYSGGISLDDSNDIIITDNNIISNNQSGIHLYHSSNNNILKNNIESNNFSGIMLLDDSSNNNVENNQISNYAFQGITVSGSSNNIIKNNKVSNNQYGIRLLYSNKNTIYNNYFNNTNNSIIQNSTDNIWNISRISGINIIGGPYIGGNFWANSSGTGYSQTCLGEPHSMDKN
ncbi:MAG: hypothetical protein C3F06_03910 [Candidatus Methanoperedenaceae archaeon]|nr:MAG: hypothetical protein C3F06_03910 [Candidatus Methanoperedenaceae archaeon]